MKRLVAYILMLLGISLSGAAESPKPVKGTHIILTPPPGFAVADRFPGFMSEETGASIMVTELSAAFAEGTKAFNAGGFRNQGMTLLSQEKAQYGTYNGLLISVAQSASGVDFLKWMAAFGDEKTTFMVTATFPKAAETELSDALKKAVMGARASTMDVDPFDALTFRISQTNDMKLAKVIANSILLSKGGAFPAKVNETPIFTVAASASKELNIPNTKAFAESRIKTVATLKEVQLKTTEPARIDGLDGFESIADALHVASGAKMLLYQVVLFDADGYYLMQGIAPEREGKAQLPTFKAIARSFKRVKNHLQE